MPTYRTRLLSPVDPETLRYQADAFVQVDAQGRIAQVEAFHGQSVDEDLRPGVLVPGFVDAHVHYPQARIIGAASGPLLTWLSQTVFPEEARFSDPSHAEAVARQFCYEMARAGTTLAMVYGSVHAEAAGALFTTLDQTGQRAIAGPVLMDRACPAELQVEAPRALAAVERLASRWHGHDRGRLQVAVIPRFAVSCTQAMLSGAGALAERLSLPVTTHLAENHEECRQVLDHFGTEDYLEVYEGAGLVRENAVMAHCLHLDEGAWDRFAHAGAVVAHCPDSNAFLGSGSLSIQAVLDREIPLSVGTDVAAGRSFRVSHTLSAAYDNSLHVGADISPARLFWWGTRGGALALGCDEAGLLEPGFDADMVLLDVPLEAEDPQAILASVLFRHDGPGPRATWVRGKEVWRRPVVVTPSR